MNILIIEDDFSVGKAMQRNLANSNFTNIVELTADYDQAIMRSSSGLFDLVIVDLFLENDDCLGLNICKEIRGRGLMLPIVIVTATYSLQFMEEAFGLGINDYITKPFNSKELELRVKRWGALSYRNRERMQTKLHYRDLSFNTITNKFTWQGREFILPKKQKELLMVFLRNPEELLKVNYIENKLWGDHCGVTKNRNLRSNIQYLRKSLKKLGINWIQTIRGEGYILKR